MSTTHATDVRDRLHALNDELVTIYENTGRAEMFSASVSAARRHGVTELWHLVYVAYRVSIDCFDYSAAFSAVAQYAAAALRDDTNPEGLSPEQRCAYIAAATLRDFQLLDDDGDLDADAIVDSDFLTFAAHTVTLANVRDPSAYAQPASREEGDVTT
jgi:hypothetical protein